MRPTLLIALVSMLAPSAATAAPFTWVVTGTIISASLNDAGPYAALLPVGQNYTWSITMESSAADVNPSPTCGQYSPITAMTFNSGSLSLAAMPGPGGQDAFVGAGTAAGCDVPAGAARIRSDFGSNAPGLFLSLSFLVSGNSDALPLVSFLPGATVDFFYPQLPTSFLSNTAIRHASATITAVPEPAGALLAMLGLAAHRRRRSASRKMVPPEQPHTPVVD